MVAVQTIAGAALGVLGSTQAGRLPQLHPDPKTDAAIKAAIGLVLIAVGALVFKQVGWGKTVTTSLGVGVMLAAIPAAMRG